MKLQLLSLDWYVARLHPIHVTEALYSLYSQSDTTGAKTYMKYVL